MKSKTIGILGLGSYSTLFYREELNALYNKKHKGFSTCPFKMLNINFDKINNLLPNTSDELDRIVKIAIDELINLGISSILVPNITLHETIDRLEFKTKIIHPVHCTLSEVERNNHKKAVLFGSKYTMESDYIKLIFETKNIDILRPSEEEMLFIDHVRKQVYLKLETEEMLGKLNGIINKYTKKNAVIIACTELSVPLSKHKENVFDMARIQIKYALKEIELAIL